jgi:hypothetical protein
VTPLRVLGKALMSIRWRSIFWSCATAVAPSTLARLQLLLRRLQRLVFRSAR